MQNPLKQIPLATLKNLIKVVASRYGVTKESELGLIYLALEEKNDAMIADIFTPKKWK